MFGWKLKTQAATQIGDRNAGKGISKKVWTGLSEEGKKRSYPHRAGGWRNAEGEFYSLVEELNLYHGWFLTNFRISEGQFASFDLPLVGELVSHCCRCW